jgi:uncharacterized protein YjbJ (UPF0337 family)
MNGASALTAPSIHRRLLFFALAFTLAAAWVPAVAAAQSLEQPNGLVDDTLGGILDETAGAVEETVGGVGGTVGEVEETVQETVGGVQETVGGVQETVGGVQETAEKTVGDVTKEVGDTAANVGQSASDLVGSGTQSSGGSPAGSSAGPFDLGGEGSGTRTEGMLTREFARGLGVPAIFLTDGTVDVSEIFTQPTSGGAAAETGSSGGVAGVLAEIAKKIAFPLALVLVLGGFLLLHSRLDRSDPKLASAPRDTNLLHFE